MKVVYLARSQTPAFQTPPFLRICPFLKEKDKIYFHEFFAEHHM